MLYIFLLLTLALIVLFTLENLYPEWFNEKFSPSNTFDELGINSIGTTSNCEPDTNRVNVRLKRNLDTLSYISFIENNSRFFENSEHINDVLTVKKSVQEKIINLLVD